MASILFTYIKNEVIKAGYTAISCMRLGRGSDAQKSILEKTGYKPSEPRTDGPTKGHSPLIELLAHD